MARAKARWQVEGERCTNYFCNLEKRHYKEKIISNIIQDDKEISDQFQILDAQKTFYENLYSSSLPVFNQEHEGLFFDKENPFLNFLSNDEMLLCEGNLNKGECLDALKNMKNGKSPGIDGFTAEFYIFF